LVLAELGVTGFLLHRTFHDSERREWFLHGKDTGVYLGIARRFERGDFTMSFVANRPHRVPLFPACLAIALKLTHENDVALAAVNIVIACLAVAVVYTVTLSLFEDRFVVSLVAVLCLTSRFLIESNSERLMTEPLFVFNRHSSALFLCGLCQKAAQPRSLRDVNLGALGYLTRVNGLFVLIAIFGALVVFEVMRLGRVAHKLIVHETANALGRYSLALLLVLIVTAPNWWPRWHYFGNPIVHGYVTNFLWVADQTQGTAGEPVASFNWKSYLATHTFLDVLNRWRVGVYRVCATAPVRNEATPVNYWLRIVGLPKSLVYRKRIFACSLSR
jgi:hypothetical protein